MNLLRLVVGLMAGGVLLMGGMLAVAQRAEPMPQLIVTSYEGGGSTVYMVDIEDGTMRRVNELDVLDARLLTISPDGKWLIYTAGGGVYRSTLWGTRARRIEFPKVDIQAASQGYYQWSGDGEWLILETVDLDITKLVPEQHLYRVNMSTLDTEQLSQHLIHRPHDTHAFFYPTPDQNAIVYFGRSAEDETPEIDLYLVEIVSGRETRLTTMRDIEYPEGWFGDWLIYWSSTNPTLFRVRRDGTGEQPLLTDGNFEWLAHEPIAGWAYIGSYRDEADGSDLYRLRWEGTELQRLTTMEGYENFITITPDATWIYFVNEETVYRMQADGTELQAVAEGVELGKRIGWSDDGTAFYFMDDPYSPITAILSRLVTTTSTIERLGEVYNMLMPLSSDQHWLAYVRAGDQQRGVTVLETATGKEKLLKLPLASFQLFDWMPLPEQMWQPEFLLAGGFAGIVGCVGMGRLRKRA